MAKKAPSYRQRPGYTQAIVTLTDSATGKRRDYWLGEFGSVESREAYHRVLADWEAGGRRFPNAAATIAASLTPISTGHGSSTVASSGPLTVDALIREYWR